jgi:hypothetical protein
MVLSSLGSPISPPLPQAGLASVLEIELLGELDAVSSDAVSVADSFEDPQAASRVSDATAMSRNGRMG